MHSQTLGKGKANCSRISQEWFVLVLQKSKVFKLVRRLSEKKKNIDFLTIKKKAPLRDPQ